MILSIHNLPPPPPPPQLPSHRSFLSKIAVYVPVRSTLRISQCVAERAKCCHVALSQSVEGTTLRDESLYLYDRETTHSRAALYFESKRELRDGSHEEALAGMFFVQ